MHDFSLTDRDFNTRSFHDVIAQGRVIVTHTFDPLEEMPHYQYLSGLDARVVVVTSRDNPFIHPSVDVRFPSMETYVDSDHRLISQLKDMWDLDPPVEDLVNLLRFQMLFDDGKLVKSWHQPVIDHWQSFLDNKNAVKSFYRRFGTFGMKWIQTQNRTSDLLWTMKTPPGAYTNDLFTPMSPMSFFLKHYILVPNHELETIIKG